MADADDGSDGSGEEEGEEEEEDEEASPLRLACPLALHWMALFRLFAPQAHAGHVQEGRLPSFSPESGASTRRIRWRRTNPRTKRTNKPMRRRRGRAGVRAGTTPAARRRPQQPWLWASGAILAAVQTHNQRFLPGPSAQLRSASPLSIYGAGPSPTR